MNCPDTDMEENVAGGISAAESFLSSPYTGFNVLSQVLARTMPAAKLN